MVTEGRPTWPAREAKSLSGAGHNAMKNGLNYHTIMIGKRVINKICHLNSLMNNDSKIAILTIQNILLMGYSTAGPSKPTAIHPPAE